MHLYPVDRTHLENLTDDVGRCSMRPGIHARSQEHGYCVDDVARALQVDLLHARQLGWAAIEASAQRSLQFLSDAFQGTTGRFRDFRRVDGSWLEERASEDCQGRAMHALGDAIAAAPEPAFVAAARALFERALPATQELSALRAISSIALGCEAAIRGGTSGAVDPNLRAHGRPVGAAFEPSVGSDWPWPEATVTYENGLPVRALIVTGQHHGRRS